ncbi:DUF3486 family protein [Desulfovibrio desulfuricans]|uniref:phage protein Gp27 family protein n=1 Tax=Desulfovibrio desulfuricans TaxID=876 RepID=UPI00210BA1DD|nr:phage protein Gp27 family protein [Desulfovibrio desulfuricans]MCQ4861149.1 DUF3486 family protein [Desulfovibrio desulfuricans]
MPRKSSVTRLSPDLRRQIDKALTDGRMTLDELHEFVSGKCAAAGADAPSRTALWRYSTNFSAAAQVMRENRDMARALAQELGAESVEGEQGRLLVEMLRGLVYRTMQERMTEPDAKFDPAEVDKIARSLKNLSQAMSLEADFAKRIREEERKKTLDEARDKLDAAAAGGLDPAVAQEARRVLGFE